MPQDQLPPELQPAQSPASSSASDSKKAASPPSDPASPIAAVEIHLSGAFDLEFEIDDSRNVVILRPKFRNRRQIALAGLVVKDAEGTERSSCQLNITGARTGRTPPGALQLKPIGIEEQDPGEGE